MLTVHQTVSDVRGNFYQEKTVFLRCTVSSNPPARFIWKRGSDTLSHSQDNGVDIYEPLYTQVRMGSWRPTLLYPTRIPCKGLKPGGPDSWRLTRSQQFSALVGGTWSSVHTARGEKSESREIRGQSEPHTGESQKQHVPRSTAG